MRALLAACVAALAVAGLPAAASADETEPTLIGRAILPADAYNRGHPRARFLTADNGVTTPFPGQPIPGFSAV